MASVLTPYKSSDGNNPYTEAQLKALWKDLEPTARSPGKYSMEERIKLQREFLSFIQKGFSPTRAAQRLQELSRQDPGFWPYAEYATFMAWRAHDKNFAEAYEVAYAMGTDELEDKAVELAYGGNSSMLQFLLKMRNATRYNLKSEIPGQNNTVEHVHKIEIVAAAPEAPAIEGVSPVRQSNVIDADIVDAEIIDVDS